MDAKSREGTAPVDATTEPAAMQAGLGTHAVRGVAWTAMGNWFTQLSAFAVFIVLSRLLDREDFGLIALATVFVGFIQVMASQGLADAAIQRPSLDDLHLDTAFWLSIGVATVMGFLLAGAAWPIAWAVGEPRLAPVVAALAVGLPISGAGLVQRALLARQLDFRRSALRQLSGTVVGSVVGIAAALSGFGVWSLVAQNLANQLAGVALVWTVTSWRPKFRFSRLASREMLGFGLHVVGFRLLNYFNRRADDFLIGTYLGPIALGYYSVAYRIVILLIEVSSSMIDAVAFPVFSRLQAEPDRQRRAYFTATRFAAMAAFPAFGGLFAVAPHLVTVVFGQKWEPTVPVVRILALFGLVQALNYFNSTLLKSLGKPSWRTLIVAVTATLNVVGFLIAVRSGIEAVATSLVIVSYGSLPIYFYAVNRLMPIRMRDYLACLRGPAIGTAAMVAAVLGLQRAMVELPDPVVLVASILVGGLVYVAATAIADRELAVEARDTALRTIGR